MLKRITCCLVLSISCLTSYAQMQKGLLFGHKAESGFYVLSDNRLVRYPGNIKVYAHELVVKDDQGKQLKYTPDEVYSAQIGTTHYIAASGFKTKSGFWSVKQDEKLFVEVVDSGKISLYRYRYTVGGPNYSSRELETYMLYDAAVDSTTTLPVSAYTGKGKRFREALAPFVAARPDLLALLNNGSISIDELPAFVHALNANQTFVRPKPIPAFGVD